jgi:hypothetical protein
MLLVTSSWIPPSTRKDGSLVATTKKDGSMEHLESADDSGKYAGSQIRQTMVDMTLTSSYGSSSRDKLRKIKSCLFKNEYGESLDGEKSLKDYDNYIQLNVGKHYRKESDDRNRRKVPALEKNDALFKKLLPSKLTKSHTVMLNADADAASPKDESSGDEKKYNSRRDFSPKPYPSPRNPNRTITPAKNYLTFSSMSQVHTPNAGASGHDNGKPMLGADWVNMISADNGALMQNTKYPKKNTPPRGFKNNLYLLNNVAYNPFVGAEPKEPGTRPTIEISQSTPDLQIPMVKSPYNLDDSTAKDFPLFDSKNT